MGNKEGKNEMKFHLDRGTNCDCSKLFPLRKIAGNTQYSPAYLSLLVQRKKLKAKKIGKNYYTTQEWMDEYIRLYSRSGKEDEVVVANTETSNKISEAGFFGDVGGNGDKKNSINFAPISRNTEEARNLLSRYNSVVVYKDVSQVRFLDINNWTGDNIPVRRLVDGFKNLLVVKFFFSFIFVLSSFVLLFFVFDRFDSKLLKNISFVFNGVSSVLGDKRDGAVAGAFLADKGVYDLGYSTASFLRRNLSSFVGLASSFKERQELASAALDGSFVFLGGKKNNNEEGEYRVQRTGFDFVSFNKFLDYSKNIFLEGSHFYSLFLDIFVPQAVENKYAKYYYYDNNYSQRKEYFLNHVDNKVDNFYSSLVGFSFRGSDRNKLEKVKTKNSADSGFLIIPKDGDNNSGVVDIFSDKVIIKKDGDSGRAGYIKPVFEGKADEQEYIYMMVPVSE